MNLYAFELGRKRSLCLAELVTLLGEKNLLEKGLDTAIFKLPEIDAQFLQDNLGGTIKIIQIFDEVTDLNSLEAPIERKLTELFAGGTGKIQFSVTPLNFKNSKQINIKQILNFSKIFLKSLGRGSRFVNQGFRPAKPSTIYKARVIEKGIDLNIIKSDNKIYLGQSIAIQNIDNYSARDYDKPARDAKCGMMPPKLAQVMLNLAGDADIIYDPFCGTGTTIMEGLLMGKTMIGSDINPKMIEYSTTNCKWTAERFKVKDNFRVFHHDTRFITKTLLPEKVQAIVTEGYLGDPQESLPSQQRREEIFRELANLHLNWLNAIHKVTPQNCRIVMCVAAFMVGQKIEHLPKFEQLAQTAGWKIVDTYTYDRPDQIVVRDIKVLEKI